MFKLVEVSRELPVDFVELSTAAYNEGCRFIDRLFNEWVNGENTFSKKHEVLVVAYCDDQIAGVGGVTHDSEISEALRMRRFYILPEFRRTGLATQIANSLLESVSNSGFQITVNAGTADASGFWEANGFKESSFIGITHTYEGSFCNHSRS